MTHFHVSLDGHQAHRVAVRMTFDVAGPGPIEVAMPVWTPGSYLVREYARHVLDLSAADADGHDLGAIKTAKNSWRVDARSAGTVVVDYTLYANELSVRTNHVDSDHAFLAPAGTFLFVRGREDDAAKITVDTPDGWEVFTGLPRDGDGWTASDLDILMDSPLEIGPHRVVSFETRGVPHRLVVAGEPLGVDLEQLGADTALITAEVAAIFDHMPFDDYTFILYLTDGAGGGLEHLNSSVNYTSRWRLTGEKGWHSLLSLFAHEYFHSWNVKRFRPESLGPFDYETENYTTDLWVAEGITSYYDTLVPTRIRFTKGISAYLGEIAKGFRDLDDRPGAARTSLARSSWDTWIKQYRPDENSFNHSVSYYSKGAMVSMMLDLRIRRLTDGERTLAHALRLGWERYTAAGVGYPDGALRTLATETAGADLSDFFDDYVDGTAPLDPHDDLAWVGLQLAITPSKTSRKLAEDADGFKLAPSLGLSTADSNGLCRVSRVVEGKVAFVAGINVDDLILAVDEMRVNASNLSDRLDLALHDGEARVITLTIFRGQSLRTITLTPALEPLQDWKVKPLADTTPAQQAAFQEWTGWDLPGTKPAEDAHSPENGEASAES